MENKKEKTGGIGAGLIASLCLCFILFVYAPMELYLTNIEEFWMKFENMLFPCAVVFALSFAVCAAVLYFARRISKKLYYIILSAEVALTFSTYIQGNFFVKNLPPTTGTKIDWNAYPAERLKSVLAVVILLAVMLALYFILHEKIIENIAKIGCGCLCLLLAVTLVSLIITTDKTKESTSVSTEKDKYTLSETQNFIVLMIDATDSKNFKKVIEQDDELRSLADGFTYFDNALSCYPYTNRSLPNVFTGKWYENDIPFTEFESKSLSDSLFFNELKKQGYRTGLYEVEDLSLSEEDTDNYLENFANAYVSYKTPNIYKHIVKMGGMKFYPWDLKRFVWKMNLSNKYLRNVEGEYPIFSWTIIDFHNQIKDKNPIELTQDKCARIIHVEGSHVPFNFDPDFNRVEDGSYNDKVLATGKAVKEYLKLLKESGVYDNASIVILADHGYCEGDEHEEENVKNRFNPMLMVKGIGESHELKFSDAPISYTDLDKSFVKLINGASSDDCFDYKSGDTRERRVLLFYYDDSSHMTEYVTDGAASDYKALRATGKTFDLKK